MKPLMFFLALATGAPVWATPSEATLAARQSLKNYGLSRCLLTAYPQPGALRDDVAEAVGAYYFLGRGQHRIHQDEDTLETLHDPYAVVADYFREAMINEPVHMKQGGANAFAGCLEVYHSPGVEELVHQQDDYILPRAGEQTGD
ncbi:hypothetical protein [Halopseudomonas bauzanensis]|uniref:Uncharacterized protein n=1 Tax=Halopseudomonas bauzanensis TaxID=653930 RepID=A0A1I4LYH1_9GAMM|nr:hypothetical protein [Halopseudomonas bauzanensis]SER83964.1 hypothetical protein SAMN05216589_1523 [Halopseudomonas bauzanensis]SFL95883.1 hypothetical protein SAMN04487855_1791 [Halopseudomonas bauzanensis]